VVFIGSSWMLTEAGRGKTVEPIGGSIGAGARISTQTMVVIDPASPRRDGRPLFHRCAICVRQ